MNKNLSEMVKILADGGHLDENDLMYLIRIGVSKMSGLMESDLFLPIGRLVRDMRAGESIFCTDIAPIPKKQVEFHKFNSI